MMFRSLILLLLVLPTFAAENIKAVGAVSKANIKAVGAVAEANVKAFGAVDNTGGGGYTPNATTFAGDDQCWMERDGDPTGIADGKACTFSFWINWDRDNVAERVFYANGGRYRLIRLNTDNKIYFNLDDAGGNGLVALVSSSALTAAGGWYHIMISVDKSVETRRHFYINGVDELNVSVFLSDDVDGNTADIDFTAGDLAIGAIVGGTSPFDGCLSEFYFSTSYIDLSNSSNRDIFYNAGGPPQDLSAVNSPIVYFKNDFSTFTVNSGSGGDFTKYGTTAFTSCTAP